MLVAVLVIIGLSVLILGHEAGHFFVAKLFKLKIDEFGFGFPPRIFAKKKGETEYSLNWLPFGGFVRITGENDQLSGGLEKLEVLPPDEKKMIFLFQPAWKRSLIILAGVGINFLIGWFLISLVLAIGTPPALVISGIQPGSPAEKAGILRGDVVKNYEKAEPFIDFINSKRGEEMTLEIRRGDQSLVFNVVPRFEVKEDEGALGVFLAEAGEPQHSFFSAFYEGLKRSLIILWLTAVAFYEMIKNLLLHGLISAEVVGPIGIFSVAGQTARIGLIYLAQLISLISLNLTVINLIPFPALDGGRFLMILIEKIKGSPVPRKVEAFVNAIGFAFLLFLMVIVTVRDIIRLF